MYIIDDKVFLHFPKSGGTSIRNSLIKNRYEDLKYVCWHKPYHEIPEMYKKYEKITLVRNPITWYKSYYNYSLKNPAIFYAKICLFSEDGKRLDFSSFLEKALNFKESFQEKKDFFKKTFVFSRYHKTIHSLEFDFNNPELFETLYQQVAFKMGIMEKDVKIYRMEESIGEVFELLKIPERKDNCGILNNKISNKEREKIFQRDNFIFQKFGYKKLEV